MKSMHHFGVTARDLDASIRFYHDVLDLDFVNEPTEWLEGEALGKAVGVPGGSLRQVSLKLGDTTFERSSTGRRPRRPAGRCPRNRSAHPTSGSWSTTFTPRRLSSRRRASSSSVT
jgi:catechol 2,3-dioxygenase-like lactoylglutathione lyase family enzyme